MSGVSPVSIHKWLTGTVGNRYWTLRFDELYIILYIHCIFRSKAEYPLIQSHPLSYLLLLTAHLVWLARSPEMALFQVVSGSGPGPSLISAKSRSGTGGNKALTTRILASRYMLSVLYVCGKHWYVLFSYPDPGVWQLW